MIPVIYNEFETNTLFPGENPPVDMEQSTLHLWLQFWIFSSGTEWNSCFLETWLGLSPRTHSKTPTIVFEFKIYFKIFNLGFSFVSHLQRTCNLVFRNRFRWFTTSCLVPVQEFRMSCSFGFHGGTTLVLVTGVQFENGLCATKSIITETSCLKPLTTFGLYVRSSSRKFVRDSLACLVSLENSKPNYVQCFILDIRMY